MENMNITKFQASQLVEQWGAGFWRLVPAHVVKSVLGLQSVTDMAKLVGKSVTTFRWHMTTGQIPEPSVVIHKAAYYSPEDALKIGLYFKTRGMAVDAGGRVAFRKFKRAECEEMRRLWLKGEGQPEIAKLFGTTQSTVSRVIRRKR